MNQLETIDIVMPIEDGRHISQTVLESIIGHNTLSACGLQHNLINEEYRMPEIM